MSDDQLNNDLKSRIKQVFDNYQDGTANEGWALLREKYPEKERKPVVAWLWRVAGAAALLLAVLSTGLWLNFQHPPKNRAVANVKKAVPANTATHATPLIAKTSRIAPALEANSTHLKQTKQVIAAYSIAIASPLGTNAAKSKGKLANTNNAISLYHAGGQLKNAVAVNISKTSTTNFIIHTDTVKPALKLAPATAMATTAAIKPAPAANQTIVTAKKPAKSIESMFDNDNKYNAMQTAEEAKLKYKRVAFGIYAATYVNYAKGSTNQFNSGGGLTVDIKLTDNLSISTGLSIAQNSLSFNNSSAAAATTVLAAATSHNFQNETGYALEEINPTSKNLNASLVDLDVPVDLKYVFDPKKGNIYVAAGLSSGTFINESYNYSYNYTASNNSFVQPPQQSSNHSTFDNFYLAKMLNVSFGVGYPLGKSQLIIEPFFKYPLDGLGDQHILFGSGGLNLKLNFDPPKKR
jgi:hypothetical protein